LAYSLIYLIIVSQKSEDLILLSWNFFDLYAVNYSFSYLTHPIMSLEKDAFYQESGHITPSRLALGVGVIIASAIILAYAYGLIIYFSPLVYINAIICAGFGFALGYIANIAGRLAHLRSLAWRIGFGVLAGLLGYLFHWCAYIPALMEEGGAGPLAFIENLSMIFRPAELFGFVSLINSVGAWEIFGLSNAGAFGVIVWLIEMGIIIVIPILMTSGAKIHPYSETQGRFYDKHDVEDSYSGSVSSPASFAQAVVKEGFAPFEQLTPPDPRVQYKFSLYYLNGENRHYLDVNRVVHSVNNDGKAKTTITTVIDNLGIDTATAQRIRTDLKAKKSNLSIF